MEVKKDGRETTSNSHKEKIKNRIEAWETTSTCCKLSLWKNTAEKLCP